MTSAPPVCRQLSAIAAGAALTFLVGCASPKLLAAPRVDLGQYGVLGLVAFSSDRDAQLGEHATSEFLRVLTAQRAARVVELGPESEIFPAGRGRRLDVRAIRAIGQEYGVDALLIGRLQLKDIKPRLSLSSSLSVNVQAAIDGTLSARIVDTHSGATLWADSAQRRQPVASIHLRNGLPRVDATDPDNAYAKLVRGLIHEATSDFRAHWVKQ